MAFKPEIVVATLNVSFDGDSDTTGGLKLEIDDREDGLNGGETSFKPGDDVYYFMFKDDNVDVLTHQVTSGGFSSQGRGTKEIDENISFSNSDSASLGYPPDGSVTMKWLGRTFEIEKNGQVYSYSGMPDLEGSELKIPGGKSVAGVLNCKYNSTGDLFNLSGVPKDILETMVIAVGRTKERE